jgi:hypothetical protein
MSPAINVINVRVVVGMMFSILARADPFKFANGTTMVPIKPPGSRQRYR